MNSLIDKLVLNKINETEFNSNGLKMQLFNCKVYHNLCNHIAVNYFECNVKVVVDRNSYSKYAIIYKVDIDVEDVYINLIKEYFKCNIGFEVNNRLNTIKYLAIGFIDDEYISFINKDTLNIDFKYNFGYIRGIYKFNGNEYLVCNELNNGSLGKKRYYFSRNGFINTQSKDDIIEISEDNIYLSKISNEEIINAYSFIKLYGNDAYKEFLGIFGYNLFMHCDGFDNSFEGYIMYFNFDGNGKVLLGNKLLEYNNHKTIKDLYRVNPSIRHKLLKFVINNTNYDPEVIFNE